jgi:hypothetical protein
MISECATFPWRTTEIRVDVADIPPNSQVFSEALSQNRLDSAKKADRLSIFNHFSIPSLTGFLGVLA